MNSKPKKIGKKVLITGGSGFIGHRLAQFFYSKGYSVFTTDRVERERYPFEEAYSSIELPNQKLEGFISDIKPDFCVHCAGGSSVGLSVEHPEIDFSWSVPVTFQLLDALRKFNPSCRTIFISSAAVYGNPEKLPIREDHPPHPISPYGFNKWMCEKICEEFSTLYNLPILIVRIFSAYGIGLQKQIIWDLCNKIKFSSKVELWGTGNETRDFINIKEICRVMTLLMDKGNFKGSIYNVATGIETKISELAKTVMSEFKERKTITYNGKKSLGDPENWVADITKIRDLGFIPDISLKQGIGEYVEHFKKEIGE